MSHYDAPYGYVRLHKYQCSEWGVDWDRDAIPYDWPGWELKQHIVNSHDRVRHRGRKGCYRYFRIIAEPDENGLLFCANDLLINFPSGRAWTAEYYETLVLERIQRAQRLRERMEDASELDDESWE